MMKINGRLYSFANIFSCFNSRIVIKLREFSHGILSYLGYVRNYLLIEENTKIGVY